MGSSSKPRQLAPIGHPVSVCHQWVDHWNAELLAGPQKGIRVAALAGQDQGAQGREVVFADVLTVGVFTFNRAKGGGRGKQNVDIMLGDDAPKGARIGGADRFAFVEHGGAALE